MAYNIEDCGNYFHVGVRLERDLKKGEWINLTAYKKNIKDRTLDDDIIRNNI